MSKNKKNSGQGAGEEKNYIKNGLPEMLVLFLCLIVLSVGIAGKEGYHMDELLSFELANARFTPWIVPTQPEGRLEKFVKNEIDADSFGETVGNLAETVQDVLTNRGNSTMLSYVADVYEEPVWIEDEAFEDYITVDGKDAFNYLSVYFNVKDDNHPPLHFMLVHTMSSLFQGKIAPIMGCAINVAAVLGVMILLRKLGELLWEDRQKGARAGLLAALLYGLSAGAMATTLLIRMYALVTFFCVAVCFLHVKKWKTDGFTQGNKKLILVTVLGFVTQYFFLFYCLILALVTAICLFAKKKYKQLLCYIRSMVIAAVIGVGIFPFAISDVFSSGRGVQALDNLSEGFSGYGQRLMAFGEIVSGRTFGVLLWPLLVIAVVSAAAEYVAHRKESATHRKESADVSLSLMMILPVAGYFFLAARMSPYQVDRYIMPIFPFVVFLVVWGLAKGVLLLCDKFEVSAKVRTGILAVCSICLILWQFAGICRYDGSYQYEGYAAQEQMAETYSETPCICVYAGVGYYENLVEFTSYDKTLLVKTEELAGRKDKDSVTELSEVVVLVKYGADFEEVRGIMEENYGFLLDQFLIRESVHGDTIALFVRQ